MLGRGSSASAFIAMLWGIALSALFFVFGWGRLASWTLCLSLGWFILVYLTVANARREIRRDRSARSAKAEPGLEKTGERQADTAKMHE
jgi:hypothetical protein